MMDQPVFEDALKDTGVNDYLSQSLDSVLARSIAADPSKVMEQKDPNRLPRLALLFESRGIAYYHRLTNGRGQKEEEERASRNSFLNAFVCWQSLLSLPDVVVSQSSKSQQRVSQVGLRMIKEELPENGEPAILTLAFRLAVAGLLARRPAETRLELRQFDLLAEPPTATWRDQVIWHVFKSFALLCRKDNGWADIDGALASISQLRALQKQHEDKYVESRTDLPNQRDAAYELVGLYHLAQMITTAGDYLKEGQPAIAQINALLDRHRERAILSFEASHNPYLTHDTELLWVGCREIARNAIWTHVMGLGERAREYARLLTSKGHPNPVIELWPSQQEAFSRNLMDPYKRAILIEMPTSAGKTLLAKFLMVQTKALNPNGSIMYVVPTRALVNQVTIDLRTDFKQLSPTIRVEQAVPAFELDPTEDRLLANQVPDVLVTTPEKLDLLVRKQHPVVQNISLVIADEAHNLGTPDRGPRLELLLGMLRRDRAGIRFVLLSPFLPNADELVTWLGGDQALPPIAVDWKPSRKIVGVIKLEGRKQTRILTFETVKATDNTDVNAGIKIPIATANMGQVANNISGLTRASIHSFIDRGAVLVLCRGQGTAVERAEELREELPKLPEDEFVNTVIRYLETEAGIKTSLAECIEHGVAYHHAGLSPEARLLVETLIKRDRVKVICGTTTLAQGVNFPISTVIIETLRKGRADLTYQDFWNIAGRAGRALVDTLGVVAFPVPQNQRLQGFEEFLQGEATAIASQLATLIDSADQIADRFDLNTIARWPALSSLMQFLAHAFYVSGREDVGDEVEDILRASLVYHQAEQQGEKTIRSLITLCQSYLSSLRGQRGLVALAEQTGFATPSVLRVLQSARQDKELTDLHNWAPSNLFGTDVQPLTKRIEVIGSLPEIQLGAGVYPPFNPRRVAQILRDWVQGDSLKELTEKHSLPKKDGKKKKDESSEIGEFSRYLFSQLISRASWGLGALETVSLAGIPKEQWKEVGYIPSMVYFGVSRREAVWLRMAGVPRLFADSLAGLWKDSNKSDPDSFDEIRNWVGKVADKDWRTLIPANSKLTPSDVQLLCKELVG